MQVWFSPHGTEWEAETYEEALEAERDALVEQFEAVRAIIEAAPSPVVPPYEFSNHHWFQRYLGWYEAAQDELLCRGWAGVDWESAPEVGATSNPASTTSGEDKQKDRNLGADSPEGALAAVGENPTVCRHCGLPGPTRCWCGQYDDPSGESHPASEQEAS